MSPEWPFPRFSSAIFCLAVLVFLLHSFMTGHAQETVKPAMEMQINSFRLIELMPETQQFRCLDTSSNEKPVFSTHSFFGSMYVKEVGADRVVFESFDWLLPKAAESASKPGTRAESEESSELTDGFSVDDLEDINEYGEGFEITGDGEDEGPVEGEEGFEADGSEAEEADGIEPGQGSEGPGPGSEGMGPGAPGMGPGMGNPGMEGMGPGTPGSGPGMSGPGMSGPGMSGPGMSGPGMSGPGTGGMGPGMSGPGAGTGGMGTGTPGMRGPGMTGPGATGPGRGMGTGPGGKPVGGNR